MSKKRISEENTFVVAILTESGAPFNEEGVDYVHGLVIKNYPDMKGKAIIAMMGDTVYKPEQLATMLDAHPDAFIVLSYKGGEHLSLLEQEDNNIIAADLHTIAKEQKEATSWEILDYAVNKKEV